jgi:hypothetical protein
LSSLLPSRPSTPRSESFSDLAGSLSKKFPSFSPTSQQALINYLLDRACSFDPLYWLQNFTKTFDEHWQEKRSQPYARFPDKPYMPWLFKLLTSERRLFIPKSREMMISWAVVGYGVWRCQFFPRTRAAPSWFGEKCEEAFGSV